MTSATPSPGIGDAPSTSQLHTMLFLLGWATGDGDHLGDIPEELVRGLGVTQASMRITRADGSPFRDFAFSSASAAQVHLANATHPHACEFTRHLGKAYHLHLRVDASPRILGHEQQTLFNELGELLAASLTMLLVGQRQRSNLGAPYKDFSDKEWDVCERLEGPESEKVIADQMATSRHTIHCHVKNIYRKLGVQSRLEVLHKLRAARAEYRRRFILTIVGRGGDAENSHEVRATG